jgi:hypothetical protein
MAEKPSLGLGTLLQVGDGAATEAFTTIAKLTSIKGPKLTRETKESTHMESEGGYKEYLGGLLDGGEITFEGDYVPRDVTHGATSGTGLFSQFDSALVGTHNCKMVLPGTPTASWAFVGIFTSLETSEPVDDKMTISGTIKISGKPVLTIASS